MELIEQVIQEWTKTRSLDGITLSDFKTTAYSHGGFSSRCAVIVDRRGLPRSALGLYVAMPLYRGKEKPLQTIHEALDKLFTDSRLTGSSVGELRYSVSFDIVYTNDWVERFALHLQANPKDPWYD